MPIYEYKCRDCGKQFECLVRADEQAACPSCGGRQLDKQLSAPAAHTQAATSSSCSDQRCDLPGGCCGGSCPFPSE